jgi:PPP family 3-phenylpropionic acid transporter
MHALPYWRLSGYYFFYFAFLGAFSPYFGLYLDSLNFSAWDIALLMSQMQLMRLFGPNLWGWVADHFGRRMAIIRLAGVISLTGFLAFFWLDKLPGMLLAMAVLAFFWSAALPLVETLTFDHLRDRPEGYSRIRVWGSVGFIVAVMLTGAVLDKFAVTSVLWVCSAILLGIFGFAQSLPEAPAVPHGKNDLPVMAILRQPHVWALLASCLVMSAAHGAFYIFFSIHLAGHGYSNTQIGLLWSLGVLAEIGLFMVMGRLLKRYSLRLIFLVCFAVAVLRFLLMGWGVESVAVMVFVQLLHGLTFGAYHASSIAAVKAWFPGKAQSRGQALYSSLSFGAGGLIGGVVSGWVWDSLGAGWAFTLGAIFALIGYLLVWRWVGENATVDSPGEPKTSDPVQ